MDYPSHDRKLKQVESWVDDIRVILRFCPKRRVCVQAGGAVGVWPRRLAESFSWVYTFEPHPQNFAYLVRNCEALNVVKFQAAVGSPGFVSMHVDGFERDNAGAYYTRTACDGIPSMTIDSLGLSVCDLVQLDVEGAEHSALMGARRTIQDCKPTVVIEEKPLPHMNRPHTAARELLESWGYKERATVHRDVIFTC